jgi:hypothetical protein
VPSNGSALAIPLSPLARFLDQAGGRWSGTMANRIICSAPVRCMSAELETGMATQVAPLLDWAGTDSDRVHRGPSLSVAESNEVAANSSGVLS